MGMFDYVNYEATCDCGEKLTDFQSKDGPCELGMVEPYQVKTFYTMCGKCGRWHEWEVEAEVIVTKLNIRKVK